jgi:hypothetical protein
MNIGCFLYGHDYAPVSFRGMCRIIGDNNQLEGYVTQARCKNCTKFKDIITWCEVSNQPLPKNVVPMRKR